MASGLRFWHRLIEEKSCGLCLFMSRNSGSVFYDGFSFFCVGVLEDQNSENYNERTRGQGGAYDSDCSL